MKKRFRKQMELAEIGIRERRRSRYEAERIEAERKFRAMRQA